MSDLIRDEKKINIVVFTLSGQHFAVDVKCVREVLMFREISPVPKTPEFIEGVIDLRGHIIGIVDLRKYFDLNSRQINKDTRIIITRIKDALLGIIVDSVLKVVDLDEQKLENAPEVVSSQINNDVIAGVAKINEKMTIVLDLASVLSDKEIKHLLQVRRRKING
ncbi:MAG TPA: chemotaxis protein CheW [Candidatus Omnitrophica bacterium]|nr:chemotaxis protein CheW [Candidatus Omnitrophota bacterium]